MVFDKTWIGRQHQVQDEIVLENISLSCQIGFSVGKKKTLNEDCLRVGDNFIAVTDGHWGYGASKYIINHTVTDFLPVLKKFTEKNKEKDIILTELADILWNHNNLLGQESKSETSFVIAYANNNYLCWFSFGDSFVFALDVDGTQYQNRKKSKWLGNRIFNKEELRSFCEFNLIKNWQKVLVMSDGIPECIYGKPTILSDEIFKNLINDPDSVKKLITKAMDCGGEDNIAIAGMFKQF